MSFCLFASVVAAWAQTGRSFSFWAPLCPQYRAPPPPPLRAALQEDSYRGSCAVRGALPPWLRGTLLRSGPGLWEVGERQLRHLHDGKLA